MSASRIYQVGEFDNAQLYWNQAASTYAKIQRSVSASCSAQQSLALAQIARGDFVLGAAVARRSLHHAEKPADGRRAQHRASPISPSSIASKASSSCARSRVARSDDLQAARGSARHRRDAAAALRRSCAMPATGTAPTPRLAESRRRQRREQRAGRDPADAPRRNRGSAAAMRRTRSRRRPTAVSAAQEAHSYGTELSARLLRARALHAQKKTKDAATSSRRPAPASRNTRACRCDCGSPRRRLQINGAAPCPIIAPRAAELARLPAYVRAFEIHALAAARCADRPTRRSARRARARSRVRRSRQEHAGRAAARRCAKLAGVLSVFDVTIPNE